MNTIEFNNKLCEVGVSIPLTHMSDSESIAYRNRFGYDIVIKNNTHYFFCYVISDAEYVDIPETEQLN